MTELELIKASELFERLNVKNTKIIGRFRQREDFHEIEYQSGKIKLLLVKVCVLLWVKKEIFSV